MEPLVRVLLISKPVVPPWNDSGKNLVRDLAEALRGYRATVMGCAGGPALGGGVRTLPIYPQRAARFAPRRIDQARVLARLALDREHTLWHYFFAPNPVSCAAGGALRRLRARPTVHTVSSAPRSAEAIVPRLFADVHVVLSTHTETALLEAGLAADRVVRIPPCVPPMQPASEADRATTRRELGLPLHAPLVLFPGDLEFGAGARLCVDALEAMRRSDAQLVLACRAKTSGASAAREALEGELRRRGLSDRTHWLGETPAIHPLLAAVDVVALPSRDLYAKMDYPLVLLEAMALQRPVVVAEGSAAAELSQGAAALAVPAHGEALAAAFDELLGDDARRRELGRRAAARVRTEFAPDVMARAYAALYDGFAS